jgi:hypothetical protein
VCGGVTDELEEDGARSIKFARTVEEGWGSRHDLALYGVPKPSCSQPRLPYLGPVLDSSRCCWKLSLTA